MKQIRNWYRLLEGAGVTSHDSGPGLAHGTLSPNVTWCPYYYPPGTQLGHKGVTIAASQSRIVSAAAAGLPPDAGSIEMLCRPTWNNADSSNHFFWDTGAGPNRRFCLWKHSSNLTYLFTDETSRGNFTYAWTANELYHIVLNWGTNQLYINGVLAHTFIPGGLALGASNLYIGDQRTGVNTSFSGNIYYFISRDVALTLADIQAFRAFFENQYIPL